MNLRTPKQFREWTKSREVWGKYLELLSESDVRLKASLETIFEAAKDDPKFLLGGPRGWSYKAQAWSSIHNERLWLQSKMNEPTRSILETLYNERRSWIAAQPELIGTSMGALDSRVGAMIANTDLDMGKRIPRLLGDEKKARWALNDAERRFRLGELEGASIDEMIRDIRINTVGLGPYQRAKGATSQIRTTIRTQMARMDYDIMQDFGRDQGNVVGVKIQRGPGVCTNDVCGAVLGVPENGIAVFIYGVNDPPFLPIHPNSYACIVGYVYKSDSGWEKQGEAWTRNMQNPRRRGDYDQYKAFSKSHEGNYKAYKEYLKNLNS